MILYKVGVSVWLTVRAGVERGTTAWTCTVSCVKEGRKPAGTRDRRLAQDGKTRQEETRRENIALRRRCNEVQWIKD